jgi:phosphatidylinositol alpha-mannosyltransferase
MRIAQVCPYDYHQPGGVQVHIRDLSARFRKLGHDVTVIAPNSTRKRDDEPNVVHVGQCRGVNFNKTHFEITIARGDEKRRLDTLFAPGQFDVIHFHTIWTPLIPAQILRRAHCATVATFHDTPPDTLAGAITRLVFRGLSWYLLRRLDAAIAVSGAPARHLVRAPGKPFHFLPPCTDLSRFTEEHAPLDQYRDGRVNILFLGRLEARKGILELLRAYERLQQDETPIRLIVAGEGELMPEVRRFIRDRNLEAVELVGAVDDAAKLRLFATCDLFCSPALYGESFGIVLVEAMASGKPVVAVANRGYVSVMQGDAAPFLTRPGDIGDLYEKLRTLIENPALRSALGGWGRQTAPQYDCRAVAPKYLEVYREASGLEG